ncbi:aKG-HExxH-type peptide beta-hydroxylase [Flavobacterium alkalisoli]|uniref:aKG-HExxH-type peptide beta-hydroxylase n=1 Tax=Flavobacterium alkalisoli TaxID=2602769 RepID=UPI003A907552
MAINEKINAFLEKPFPLWENDLTAELVAAQWKFFREYGIWPENYSTTKGLFWDRKLAMPEMFLISGTDASDGIQLEMPQEILSNFYEQTGLEPIAIESLDVVGIPQKLKDALALLGQVPGMMNCLTKLVKAIQVLRQDDPEIDTSHSDPQIPFSIFVSVCEDNSPTSNLRVAESILHEAMHLKLTLIEKHVDLIVSHTQETFYSPWRDEQRPVRGVLHGLFVFSAVSQFYSSVNYQFLTENEIAKFIAFRNKQIVLEIQSLLDFHNSNGLTSVGKLFVKKLIAEIR